MNSVKTFLKTYKFAIYIVMWRFYLSSSMQRSEWWCMIVSSESVYELWEVLDKYRDLRHSL